MPVHRVLPLFAAVATLVPNIPVAAAAEPLDPLPVVFPEPRSMKAISSGFDLSGPVELVTTGRSDRPAVDLTAGVLRRSGSGTGITAYVGGPSENPASAQALKDLGVDGPDGLPPGGYVLAIGNNKVVLAGVDPAGTFYAAQTLRQLVRRVGDSSRLPGVVIQDFPAFGLRGGMESFYGTPWRQEDLLRHLDWLGQHRMNAFQYTVSGDPRTVGAIWRQPYPPAELDKFREAIARAEANHVDFIYRINPETVEQSPVNAICHARQSDLDALVARYQQLWDAGERTFSLGWDDRGANDFPCQEDRNAFNGRPDKWAAAQAHVVNHVYHNFIRTHAGANLVTVPSHYAGTGPSTYRSEFARLIPADVPIFWTGREVISPTIPLTDLTQAEQAFGGRRLLIFDNYPVNDYSPTLQHLGPLVGRDPALSSSALGLLANEMQEPEASLLSLYTVAEFTWNPSAYNAADSWTRSLQEFGGSAYPALRKYAESSWSSPLHPNAAPALQPLVTAFRQAYRSRGDVSGTGDALLAELAAIRQAPAQLRSQMTGNPSFLRDSEPWFVAAENRAAAAEHAVRALRAQVAGNVATYRTERRAMGLAMAAAGSTGKAVAPGVYDELFDLASSPRASTVLRSDNGALSLFARGTDGQLYISWQTSAGSSWQPFTRLPLLPAGVTMVGQPEVIIGRNGLQTAFVLGSDRTIWHTWQINANGDWRPRWDSLGGTAADSPKVVTNDDGVNVLFIRGTDGQLWHKWQTSPGGNWTDYRPIGGVGIRGKPDVVVARSGALAAFVRGSDDRLWHAWQSGPGGNWSWRLLGGVTVNNPRAVEADNGSLSAFIRGTDGRFYTFWQQTEGSADWFNADLGGIIQGDPEVLKTDTGAMVAFSRWANDSAVWTNWQPNPGGSWHGWVSIGGSVTGKVRAIDNRHGAFSVYALSGNRMHTSWQFSPGSGWSGWVDLGGSLTD